MTIHHILIGKAVNINSNIVRFFSTYWRDMETQKDDHVFHIFQRRNELSAEELPYYSNLPVDGDRLTFLAPRRVTVLKVLLRVKREDIIIIHSGRMSDLFLMLLLTPWLWRRTALICFGGEIRIWRRIAGATDWKSRVLKVSQQVVIPRIKAVCTLTPGEYDFIKALFPRADNYQRAFMSSSRRCDPEVVERRPRAASATVRVLLNQSANGEGRHQEALEWLMKFKDEDVRVTCPVAFGEESEARAIIQAGRACLGEKFSFIKEKRPYDEYSRMVRKEMDILVLNHLGQAGLGHLYMFLCEGKPAYVRKETPVYNLLMGLGFDVRATNSIADMSFEEFAQPLTRGSAEKNAEHFNRHLSTEAAVDSCKRLIRVMRHGRE